MCMLNICARVSTLQHYQKNVMKKSRASCNHAVLPSVSPPGVASFVSGTPRCSEQRSYGTCTAQDGLQGVAVRRPDGALVVVVLNAANLSAAWKIWPVLQHSVENSSTLYFSWSVTSGTCDSSSNH